MPTQLNIVLTTSGTPTVVVPISAALQALDSNNSSGSGQASQQTGFSAIDIAVRNIFRAGTFFVPTTNTWYSSAVIGLITWT
jgi:hypothetical protein